MMTRLMLEGLGHYDDGGNGRRAVIELSAQVISRMKQVRADLIKGEHQEATQEVA